MMAIKIQQAIQTGTCAFYAKFTVAVFKENAFSLLYASV